LGDALCADLAPTGGAVVLECSGRSMYVRLLGPTPAKPQTLAVVEGPTGAVSGVRAADDDRIVALSERRAQVFTTEGRTVFSWSAPEGTRIWTWDAAGSWVALALEPVDACGAEEIALLDPAGRAARLRLEGGLAGIVRCSPAGRAAAVAVARTDPVQWGISLVDETGAVAWSDRGLEGPVRHLDFDVRGRVLAAATPTELYVYDATRGSRLLTAPAGRPTSLAVSPGGRTVAMVESIEAGRSTGGRLVLWSLDQPAGPAWSARTGRAPCSIGWSAAGRLLVLSGARLQAYDERGRCMWEVGLSRPCGVLRVSGSLAAVSDGNCMEIFRMGR